MWARTWLADRRAKMKAVILAAGCATRLRPHSDDTPKTLLARVSGDILTIESSSAEAVAADLAEAFQVTPHVDGGTISFEASDAHALVPRIIELFPPGTVNAIAVRKPTIADVFVKLTGRTLNATPADDQ